MRERLERYRDEAKVNLKQAQQNQKRWYDKKARLRQYQSGQKVLLLLPSSTNKLLAKWQGPYTISRKMGPLTYEVHHPDKGKERQTYHVNLLKEWKEQASVEAKTVLMVRKVEVEDEDCEAQVQRQTSPLDFTNLQDPEMKQLHLVCFFIFILPDSH